uniref:(northern house mosquito) hypothetical protein n=1 Tax=Culex pipiens TaxID=7175 RepID=A0A8D8CIJ5_CULPI
MRSLIRLFRLLRKKGLFGCDENSASSFGQYGQGFFRFLHRGFDFQVRLGTLFFLLRFCLEIGTDKFDLLHASSSFQNPLVERKGLPIPQDEFLGDAVLNGWIKQLGEVHLADKSIAVGIFPPK